MKLTRSSQFSDALPAIWLAILAAIPLIAASIYLKLDRGFVIVPGWAHSLFSPVEESLSPAVTREIRPASAH